MYFKKGSFASFGFIGFVELGSLSWKLVENVNWFTIFFRRLIYENFYTNITILRSIQIMDDLKDQIMDQILYRMGLKL